MPPSNSYQALSYLVRFFSKEMPYIHHIWKVFCQVMYEKNRTPFFREDSWEQDWLLAKFASPFPGFGITAHYQPPTEYFAFPTFEVASQIQTLAQQLANSNVKSSTSHNCIEIFKADYPFAQTNSTPNTLDQFYQLKTQIGTHGDVSMIQLNHILAWMHLIMGKLFTGILLTPIGTNFQQLLDMCVQRWNHIWNEKDLYEEHMPLSELIQWKLDVFYGAEITQTDFLMKPSRQGQPENWAAFWGWLSTPLKKKEALEAVQITVGLLNSVPLSLFFQHLFQGAKEQVTTDHLLAVAIFRRWVLSLQVLNWLEGALQQDWEYLRVEDIVCFAFSTLRPHWPRRTLAISHRSLDSKPIMKDMRVWNHFSFSLDATFVPQWETNTAMVWGLFSSVPGIIRIQSQHYGDSIWCLRENELIDYLINNSDFLPDRQILDIDIKDIKVLDQLIQEDAQPENVLNPSGRFPSISLVFMIIPFEPWENKLLASLGAFRFVYLLLMTVLNAVPDESFVQEFCLRLVKGLHPPSDFPPPTNHPNGWLPIIKLFQDFHTQWSDQPDRFPLVLREEVLSEELQKDVLDLQANRITDLSKNAHELEDVFAAYEWHRTLLPTLIGDNRYGNFIAIDFRAIEKQDWLKREELMVIRGMTHIRSAYPIWYLQLAGQNVDKWRGIGKNPIFTQYVSNQWNWMWETLIEPQWPNRLESDSKMLFSQKLKAACEATSTRDNTYYQGKIR